jgi:hypothetical protein
MDQGAPATFGTSRVFWSQMCSSFNSCSSEAVRSVVLPEAKLQMREIEPQQPCGDESDSQDVLRDLRGICERLPLQAGMVLTIRARHPSGTPAPPTTRCCGPTFRMGRHEGTKSFLGPRAGGPAPPLCGG